MKVLFGILLMGLTAQAQAAGTVYKVCKGPQTDVEVHWGKYLKEEGHFFGEYTQAAWILLNGEIEDVVFHHASMSTRCGNKHFSKADLKNGTKLHFDSSFFDMCGGGDGGKTESANLALSSGEVIKLTCENIEE
jgi:hypothetical protein